MDALQRRVKEILDEYCSKAPPPEEQWPPGRRIRVRGVEIYYKVWCFWCELCGLAVIAQSRDRRRMLQTWILALRSPFGCTPTGGGCIEVGGHGCRGSGIKDKRRGLSL